MVIISNISPTDWALSSKKYLSGGSAFRGCESLTPDQSELVLRYGRRLARIQ